MNCLACLTGTVWDVVGVLLIIGGVIRLTAPAWCKKKGICFAEWLMKWIPKWSDNMVRLLGLVLIVIGAALVYFQ